VSFNVTTLFASEGDQRLMVAGLASNAQKAVLKTTTLYKEDTFMILEKCGLK
jgi:hypothetical protein